jgi:hypothetical protein
MIDFEKAADHLMAATVEHEPGVIGMDYLEWKDTYGRWPSTAEMRKVIAEHLKGFARQVIEAANEEMAKRQSEQIQKDLEAMKKK